MNIKTVLIVVGVIIFILGAYSLVKLDTSTIDDSITTFSSSELGIEFRYLTGSDGYVLEESVRTDEIANLLRTIVLMQTEDAEQAPPIGGEGPPTITMYVFETTEEMTSRAWADAHIQYSNINLVVGDVAETVVGGAPAIRYIADGLYASENIVVTNGENIYLISGMYQMEDSDLRRDFTPLVESIRFISSAEI